MLLPLLLSFAQFGIQSPYDQAGNLLQPALSPAAAGQVLNTINAGFNPNNGVARNGSTLMLTSFYDGLGLIYLADETTGSSLGSVPISNSYGSGLGYDPGRGLYIITDPVADIIQTFDASSGALVSSWSSPSAGPVGAAYDPSRDVYWISDWVTDTLSSIDPISGSVITTWNMAALGCTRTAGAAYDATNDQVIVGGRDQVAIFVVDAGTGALVRSFPANSTSSNDPQGVSDSSSGNIWHSAWNSDTISELDLGNGGLVLTFTGTCPGAMTMSVTGATPSGTLAIAYGPAGSFTIPSTGCAGVVLDISSPTLAGFFNADTSGNLNLSPSIPGAVCGLTVQVVDMTSCQKSNPVVL